MIIGIDPGKSGGLVLLDETLEGLQPVEVIKMPESESEIIQVLRSWCNTASRAYIEAIPKFAGENRSAAFMAVLYGNYKFCCGAIHMHGGALLEEMPLLKWMNHTIPRDTRSRDRSERKKQLLQVAKDTWPKHKWNLAVCDAALIAKAGHELRSLS